MVALALGAVVFAGIPYLAGLIAGACFPWSEGLRPGLSAWPLLHLLWVIPLLIPVGSALETLVKILVRPRHGALASEVVEDLGYGLVVLLLYRLYFADLLSGIVATVVAVLVSLVQSKLINRCEAAST